MWLSIYDRVTKLTPELIAEAPKAGSGSKRGKEKKRRLLAYLQEHPEELRPILRRPNVPRNGDTPAARA